MRCAVIGAGFAGMAICSHLFRCFPDIEVVLYDPNEIGNSTSGISSGLMHYYPGEKAKRSWNGPFCYQESKRLFGLAQKYFPKKIYDERGCFKPAQNKKIEKYLQKRAEQYPNEVTWWDIKKSQRYGLYHPGLFIKEALTVYPKRYLKALYTYCSSFSFSFVRQKINSLGELQHFDQIFVAAGVGNLFFDPIDREYERIKGDLLVCEKQDLDLPFPIIGKGHITEREDNKLLIGATYEREMSSSEAEVKTLLKDKIASFFPKAKKAPILSVERGIRLAQKGIYLPILVRVDPKTILLGAFGSRGLLYHAYFAKLAVSCYARLVYKNS